LKSYRRIDESTAKAEDASCATSLLHTNREGGQHAVISAIRETDLMERLVHGSAKLSAVAV